MRGLISLSLICFMSKRILIAPLNWGLGHATRCIPIIKELIHNNFEPVIGSDGSALSLLKKEFPMLEAIELPSYNINYSKNGRYFKLKLISNSPQTKRVGMIGYGLEIVEYVGFE